MEDVWEHSYIKNKLNNINPKTFRGVQMKTFRAVQMKTYPADCQKIAAVESNKHDWD